MLHFILQKMTFSLLTFFYYTTMNKFATKKDTGQFFRVNQLRSIFNEACISM